MALAASNALKQVTLVTPQTTRALSCQVQGQHASRVTSSCQPSQFFACTRSLRSSISWGEKGQHSKRVPRATSARASTERIELGTLPQELAELSQIVKRFGEDSGSSTNRVEVAKLREVVAELAEELKERLDAKSGSILEQSKTALAGVEAKLAAQSLAAASAPGQVTWSSPTKPTGGLIFEQPERDLEGVIPQGGMITTESKAQFVDRAEMNAMRSKLNKKLSEANTYNRFLLREIQYREEALRDAKAQLIAFGGEFEDIARYAAEIESAVGLPPMRSIGGLPLPSYLKSRVEELRLLLLKELSGIEAMKLREVPLTWYGMAEDVKVMGSFDGWTYGEQMSPESTETMTRFSTVLKLRPGRYEIKFLVDGEWRVAPEWPSSGHGMTENNILEVD